LTSADYRVEIPKNVARAIRHYTAPDREALADAIGALGYDPRPTGCVRLRIKNLGEYRIRVRGFRVRYDVDDDSKVVRVLAVKTRGEAYR